MVRSLFLFCTRLYRPNPPQSLDKLREERDPGSCTFPTTNPDYSVETSCDAMQSIRIYNTE